MMEKRLSHAYMLVSPAGEERDREAQRLAAALLCSETDPPCGKCRNCRKALAGIHPDIIHLRRQETDKGTLRREITVDQVRSMTADAAVAPNEAERKVYIIPEADLLNTQAQNALLKVLEDPPGHACFILGTTAAQSLLPTVQSRLVRVELRTEESASEYLPYGEEFLRLLGKDNPADLLRFCANRGSMTNGEALEFVNCVKALLCDCACGRKSVPGLEKSRALHTHTLLDKAELYLRRNLSVKHVFSMLAAADTGYGKERV